MSVRRDPKSRSHGVAEAERIERQRAIATALRSALGKVSSAPRRRMLADCALLIELADSSDEALELLGQVEQLGVRIEKRG